MPGPVLSIPCFTESTYEVGNISMPMARNPKVTSVTSKYSPSLNEDSVKESTGKQNK